MKELSPDPDQKKENPQDVSQSNTPAPQTLHADNEKPTDSNLGHQDCERYLPWICT